MTSCACLILLVIALGTRAQGRQAAPGLTRGPYGSENATCYGRRYPDLAYLLCKDECKVQALHRHFQKHGRQEGRRFDCEAAPLTAAETAKWKVHEARLRAKDPTKAASSSIPTEAPRSGPSPIVLRAWRPLCVASKPTPVARPAANRDDPVCVALAQRIREGKGHCRAGRLCNARGKCYDLSACGLCETR